MPGKDGRPLKKMYDGRAGGSPGSTSYTYIKTFKPLPWQVDPWSDFSPVLLLTGSAGGGKALHVETPVLTTDGWKTMGTVEVGDFVYDEQGNPCAVVAATNVMLDRECYRITFSTGEEIVADANHSWVVSDIKQRNAGSENKRRDVTPDRRYTQKITTEEMSHSFIGERGKSNYSIEVAPALSPPLAEPPMIPPYVLGAWLGDGTSTAGVITCADEDFEIIENVLSCGYRYGRKRGKYSHSIIGLGFHLSEMGLIGNKHIPDEYFCLGYEQRLELLRGFMDTDGSISKKGRVSITQVDDRLARDLQRLISSFGIRVTLRKGGAGYKTRHGYRVDTGTRYRMSFRTSLPLFRLARKRDRIRDDFNDAYIKRRYITDVTSVESVPVRCIEVNSPSHQFLVGDTFIATHNSFLAGNRIHGYCLRYPNSSALVLRKTKESLKNSTILMLEREVIGNDPRVQHVVGKSRFEYENGSVLSYSGMMDARQREFIRSLSLDICWMEEATQFDEEDFNEVRARMRGTAAPWRQIMLTTNPDAPGHWINLKLIIGGEASVYRSSAEDNPHNPDDYITNLQKLTGVQRQRLLEGLWVVGSGVIFDTWADRYNAQTGHSNNGSVTLDAEYIPGGGQVIWAIDDGYSGEVDKGTGMYTARSHPRVILMVQERQDGRLAVFAEHYAIHKLADEQLREASEYAEENGWPARPRMVIRDRAAASIGGNVTKVLGRNARYNQCPVEESIKETREWLARDDNGVRRVIVHPRCRHLRYEMGSYSYSDTGTVIKEHDNGPDALRYLVWDRSHGPTGEVDVATYDRSPPELEPGLVSVLDDSEIDIAW